MDLSIDVDRVPDERGGYLLLICVSHGRVEDDTIISSDLTLHRAIFHLRDQLLLVLFAKFNLARV